MKLVPKTIVPIWAPLQPQPKKPLEKKIFESKGEGATKAPTPQTLATEVYEPSLFPDDNLLTVKEVAQALGVTTPTVYKLMKKGEIRYVRHKLKQKRVLQSELERYRKTLAPKL